LAFRHLDYEQLVTVMQDAFAYADDPEARLLAMTEAYWDFAFHSPCLNKPSFLSFSDQRLIFCSRSKLLMVSLLRITRSTTHLIAVHEEKEETHVHFSRGQSGDLDQRF
jgi:hypothetical protein